MDAQVGPGGFFSPLAGAAAPLETILGLGRAVRLERLDGIVGLKEILTIREASRLDWKNRRVLVTGRALSLGSCRP